MTPGFFDWSLRMKLTNYIACLTILSASTSFAGDGERRGAHSWTGAYAGVNLGAIWTNSQFSSRHFNFLSDSGQHSETLTSADVNPGLYRSSDGSRSRL
jgi:hypothetical protein